MRSRGALLLSIPNIPDPRMPVGKDDRDNIVIALRRGELEAAIRFRPQAALGDRRGARNPRLRARREDQRLALLRPQRGWAARLQRALIAWILDLHVRSHGYTEIYPPFVVKEECLYGTAQLPKFRDNHVPRRRGRPLAHSDRRGAGDEPAPRRDPRRARSSRSTTSPTRPASAARRCRAGRDVRGIKRGHQFDKVEMVKFVAPEESDSELMTLLDDAEDVCRGLGFPYRIVEMCTGDKGLRTSASSTWRCWRPAGRRGRRRRVAGGLVLLQFQATSRPAAPTSVSGANRAQSREFVHTLNGSGLALPRVMIAMLENYQHADGSVTIPEVVRPVHGRPRTNRKTRIRMNFTRSNILSSKGRISKNRVDSVRRAGMPGRFFCSLAVGGHARPDAASAAGRSRW